MLYSEQIIKDMVYTNPLLFLNIKNQEVLNIANSYLPYSIGIEWECFKKEHFNELNFKNIPYIISVDTDINEQRFRIPNGINGLICLYNICDQLKLNSELNDLSGTHFHVDCTKFFELITDEFIKEHTDWILTELDTWGYTGTYNPRNCGTNRANWVNFQSYFKTAEFRIGEMSFDYDIIVKRILHCSNIITTLKQFLECNLNLLFKVDYKKVDYKNLLMNYLKQNLNNFNKEYKLIDNKLEIKKQIEKNILNEDIINNRIIKI